MIKRIAAVLMILNLMPFLVSSETTSWGNPLGEAQEKPSSA
jgi:hypothetical protein